MSLLSSKNIVILGILAFLAISVFGLYYMQTIQDGKITHCLFCPCASGSANSCQMTISEHVGQWNQFFTITQEKSSSLLALLALFIVTLFAINTRVNSKLPFKESYRHTYWRNPQIKLFDHLLLAFSDGLIHSKIYA